MIRKWIDKAKTLHGKYPGHAPVYIAVWITLLILTVVTVWISYFDFGNWNVFIAMLVATIKGALVCLYFMHLKYDNRVNQVVFVSAFAFLGIFVGLTASDELFRTEEKPALVAQQEEGAVDMKALLVVTPELLEKGKAIYATQCFVCHGMEGKGDGPGAGTVPPARDFTSGEWKYGGGMARIFRTITEGSPGTAMAPFGESFSVTERMALVHYVRSFVPEPADDQEEDLTWLQENFGGGKEAGPKPEKGPKIPISFAMKKLAKAESFATDVTSASRWIETSAGGKIYEQHCVRCHGVNGKGGIKVRVIHTDPFVYLKTRSFSGSERAWVDSRAQFVDLVSRGLPGSGKPGIAEFTSSEWDSLYRYVKSLRH